MTRAAEDLIEMTIATHAMATANARDIQIVVPDVNWMMPEVPGFAPGPPGIVRYFGSSAAILGASESQPPTEWSTNIPSTMMPRTSQTHWSMSTQAIDLSPPAAT